jgi:hypothetical protein
MMRELSAQTITLKSVFNVDDPFEKRTWAAKPSVPGDKTVPYNAENFAIKVQENQQAYFHDAPTELDIIPFYAYSRPRKLRHEPDTTRGMVRICMHPIFR